MNPVLKRVLTGLTIGAAVIAAIVLSPKWLFLPVVSVLIVLAFMEFGALLLKKVPHPSGWHGLGFLLGCALIGAGLLAIPEIATRRGNLMLLYVLAIIKFSDVGGFAFGLTSAKLMKGGNHKMCPTISPAKSWEGLLGSIFCSSVVSCAFMGVTHFGVGKSILFGVTAALVGTAGDLVESKFKRWVGVKDSSTMKLTNGMGGILDMLDSLLFAPAVLLAMIVFLSGCQFCDRQIIEPKNQVIRVESEQRYYLTLEENATTGYSWGYSCDDTDVEVRMDHKGPPEPKEGEPMMCGAPGRAEVCIRIHRGFDGPSTVRFFYKRPWEKEPIEQFTISLYKRTGDVAFWKK